MRYLDVKKLAALCCFRVFPEARKCHTTNCQCSAGTNLSRNPSHAGAAKERVFPSAGEAVRVLDAEMLIPCGIIFATSCLVVGAGDAVPALGTMSPSEAAPPGECARCLQDGALQDACCPEDCRQGPGDTTFMALVGDLAGEGSIPSLNNGMVEGAPGEGVVVPVGAQTVNGPCSLAVSKLSRLCALGAGSDGFSSLLVEAMCAGSTVWGKQRLVELGEVAGGDAERLLASIRSAERHRFESSDTLCRRSFISWSDTFASSESPVRASSRAASRAAVRTSATAWETTLASNSSPRALAKACWLAMDRARS